MRKFAAVVILAAGKVALQVVEIVTGKE